MSCSRCGGTLQEGEAFCPKCGAPVAAGGAAVTAPSSSLPGLVAGAPIAPAAPVGYRAAPTFVPPELMFPYAGFWLRFVAYVIDALAISIVAIPVVLVFLVLSGAGASLAALANTRPDQFVFPAAFVTFLLLAIPVVICGEWLYFAGMESSTWQATLGKRAIGLIVTDMEGKRLTFAHATGRFFAKVVTGLVPLAIGWIMAGFTQKKQALHDFIAATLVLKRV
jgi:uncharacterized RDD family membrane protein YckC